MNYTYLLKVSLAFSVVELISRMCVIYFHLKADRTEMSSTRTVYLENMLVVEYVGVTRRYDLHIYLSTFIYMPVARKDYSCYRNIITLTPRVGR